MTPERARCPHDPKCVDESTCFTRPVQFRGVKKPRQICENCGAEYGVHGAFDLTCPARGF